MGVIQNANFPILLKIYHLNRGGGGGDRTSILYDAWLGDLKVLYPHAFLKKASGILHSPPSVRHAISS